MFGFLDPFQWIDRDRSLPQEDGVFELRAQAHDGAAVAGWAWRHPAQRGTLFFLHGFGDHCGNLDNCRQAIDLGRRHACSVVAHDSRHHGWSSDHWPTFGTGEMWDFQAILGAAEHAGLAMPYVAIGSSLGGMAAQRTAIVDGRISGAFLCETPGYPWHALGCAIKGFAPLAGGLYLAKYHWDILSDGDIRRHDPHPGHEPFLLYIVGSEDGYDWRVTREVYEHWYKGRPGLAGTSPCEGARARKWFVLVEGARHTDGPGYYVYDHPDFGRLRSAFIERCLAR